MCIRDSLLPEHACRCWYREDSNRDEIASDQHADNLEWVPGQLGDEASSAELVQGCDAVVHAALSRSGPSFRGGEGELVQFVQTNLVGTLKLVQAAQAAGASRVIFISTCAVHERILDDRLLNEAHPLWSTTHYGAHKAAIEKFVHSYGFGTNYTICALRPTGIYGVAYPPQNSKNPAKRSKIQQKTVKTQQNTAKIKQNTAKVQQNAAKTQQKYSKITAKRHSIDAEDPQLRILN